MTTDTLLIFDESITRAGVEGWIQHFEAGGSPAE
jgi:3-deoxy-7-phosphoheptulonate synthase